jgi:hypothetical protein
MPDTDCVSYFDVNYDQGIEWYKRFFNPSEKESVIGEESAPYIRDDRVPQRIHKTLPGVKIIFIFRNPMQRAFSHYWHKKSRGKITYDFDEMFDFYDLYSEWVVPGFYYQHLSRYEQHIPSENIKILLFDELIEDEKEFISDIYSFIGVDSDYTPSLLSEKVNQARAKKSNAVFNLLTFFSNKLPERLLKIIRPIYRSVDPYIFDKTEYERGMNKNTRKRLENIYAPETAKLSAHIKRDLDSWFKYTDLDSVEY